MPTLETILEEFRAGRLELQDILTTLRKLPYEDLTFARVDHHRRLRRGFPEVIYGEGKTAEQITAIVRAMETFDGTVLVTRVAPEKAEIVLATLPHIVYHPLARMLSLRPESTAPVMKKNRPIAILCAGSSDIPVAEEAAVTAEHMGHTIKRFYDVGVAGLHRLLHIWEKFSECSVLVVVAGMEGALPSVVAGLVDKPVIAVPTSVGYGASFGGVAALLGMLNTCAPGVAVVNIDNGFGAGYMAGIIARSQLPAPAERA